MRIDKKTVDMLSALPDESLWKMICAIGASSGFDLSKINLKEGELDKLRSAMGQITDDDIIRATQILENCKKQEK